jgi:hypothetical protein
MGIILFGLAKRLFDITITAADGRGLRSHSQFPSANLYHNKYYYHNNSQPGLNAPVSFITR